MSNFTNIKDSSKDVDWLENSVANEHIIEYKYSDFNNVQHIGGGSFGSISRANWKDTDTICALKSFNSFYLCITVKITSKGSISCKYIKVLRNHKGRNR